MFLRFWLGLGVVFDQGALAVYTSTNWEAELASDNEKRGLKGRFVTLHPDDAAMSTYVVEPPAQPAGGRLWPAVVVAHHVLGIFNDAFLRGFADRLAGEGFLALLPDFHHRTWSDEIPHGLGMPAETLRIPQLLGGLNDDDVLEDLSAVFTYLSTDKRVDLHSTGVLGFCMGGRIAWLAAVEHSFQSIVRAAVPYHGGNIFRSWGGNDAAAPGLRVREDLHCKVLGHFGAEDTNPSLKDMRRLQDLAGPRLATAVYPGAKHGFACADSANYVEEAASSAWASTVAFLRAELQPARDEL